MNHSFSDELIILLHNLINITYHKIIIDRFIWYHVSCHLIKLYNHYKIIIDIIDIILYHVNLYNYTIIIKSY